MSRIGSTLRRLGIISYKPFLCRVCGFTVPLVGSRYEQAGVAFDHWQQSHEDADPALAGLHWTRLADKEN